MTKKPSVFEGEWWWPEWPSPSLPLAPEPREEDKSAFQAFEADLELGARVPLSTPAFHYMIRRDRDRDIELEQYPIRLVKVSQEMSEDEADLGLRLPIYYFRFLRHYHISCISHKLHYLQARIKSGVGLSHQDGEELTKLLQDQAIAVRDYEYMTTHLIPMPTNASFSFQSWLRRIFPDIGFQDSSAHSGEYCMLPKQDQTSSRLRKGLIFLLPTSLTYTKAERAEGDGLKYLTHPPRQTTRPVRIITSTIVAIAGGALLIVPMVIMSINTNRSKSLITVSCSVLLFGFFLGAVMRSKSTEIFIATATYAAVLVVFVGTGPGSG